MMSVCLRNLTPWLTDVILQEEDKKSGDASTGTDTFAACVLPECTHDRIEPYFAPATASEPRTTAMPAPAPTVSGHSTVEDAVAATGAAAPAKEIEPEKKGEVRRQCSLRESTARGRAKGFSVAAG